MKFLSIFLCLILFFTITSTSILFGVNALPYSGSFDYDFESGTLQNWDGYRASRGETIGVSSYRSYLGAYSGRATSNGRGRVEYSYCYEKLSSSKVIVRAAFYVAKSGIKEDGDRFYLMTLQSGRTTLATVGWRAIGDQVKWFLILNGGDEWTIAYSDEIPEMNKWYSITIYWNKDAINGEASLWMGSTEWDFHEVCSINGKNTATYGDASEVRIGLPTISYCDSTAVYFDCVTISNKQPEQLDPIFGFDFLVRGFTFFDDGFESGSFNRWSGTKAYNGGETKIINTATYDESYSAKFTSDGSTNYAQAYCYKNLPGIWVNKFEFGAMIKVSDLNLLDNGRISLIRAWSVGEEVFVAGWEKINGELKWFVTWKAGEDSQTSYSESNPELDTWYSLEIEENTYMHYMRINNAYIGSPYIHGGFFSLIDRVDVGLVKTSYCRTASVSVDNFDIHLEVAE